MTCNDCFEAFSCALDGELEPELQQAMTDHLESCADCRHLQARMLSLSGELKSQPFPAPDPAVVQKLAATALSEATSVSWGWLRRFLRFPYETTLLRTFFRLISSGALLLLVWRSLLLEHIWPLYHGVEAVSKNSLPVVGETVGWIPTEPALWGTALFALLAGLWTAGLPGLLVDLWNGTRLVQRDIARFGLSALLLAPVVASPLLAGLQIGRYSFACCAWAGAVLFLTFLLVAFKTQRALPKLAVDFSLLTLLLGCLEMLARKSLTFPGPLAVTSWLQVLAGNERYASLVAVGAYLGLTFLFLSLAAWGAVRSYRSQTDHRATVLLLLAGVFAGYLGGKNVHLNRFPQSSGARLAAAERTVYVLGSTNANPWVLSNVRYPALFPKSSRGELNTEFRIRLAAEFLKWNEDAQLQVLSDWSQEAPGVAYGLVSFVESLGARKGDVLSVPTEARRKTVAHLLQVLRWRKLDDVVLSPEGAVVTGKLEGADKMPLRLLPLQPGESLQQTLDELAKEEEWATRYSDRLPLDWRQQAPQQITTTLDASHGFRFSHLAPGRYALAVLADNPQPFTLNSTIPGVIEVKPDQKLDLGTIRLTVGVEGDTVPLDPKRWRTTGPVSFSQNSEAATAKIETGGSISGFIDTKVFAGGQALIKLLAGGEAHTLGRLTVTFYSKDGRQGKEWTQEIQAGKLQELQVDSSGAEGYIQVTVEAEKGPFTVKEVKVEVLSRG